MEVKFVPFDHRFLEASFKWFEDPELRKSIQAPVVSREMQINWFHQLPKLSDYLIWGVEVGGRPVGATGLKHITKDSAEYWGYLGEADMRSKGLGNSMLLFAEKKAVEMQLKKISLRVLASNIPAVRLYLKAGFIVLNKENNQAILEMEKQTGITSK